MVGTGSETTWEERYAAKKGRKGIRAMFVGAAVAPLIGISLFFDPAKIGPASRTIGIALCIHGFICIACLTARYWVPRTRNFHAVDSLIQKHGRVLVVAGAAMMSVAAALVYYLIETMNRWRPSFFVMPGIVGTVGAILIVYGLLEMFGLIEESSEQEHRAEGTAFCHCVSKSE